MANAGSMNGKAWRFMVKDILILTGSKAMGKKRKVDNQGSDFGTDETRQQGGGATYGYTSEGGKVAKLNGSQHFDQLRNRGTINETQHRAGERLRLDAERAHLFPHIKSSDDRDIKGMASDYVAQVIADAKKHFNEVLQILDSKEFRGVSEIKVIEKIVVCDGYLQEFSKNPIKCRRVKAHLLNGLNKLIDYYKV